MPQEKTAIRHPNHGPATRNSNTPLTTMRKSILLAAVLSLVLVVTPGCATSYVLEQTRKSSRATTREEGKEIEQSHVDGNKLWYAALPVTVALDAAMSPLYLLFLFQLQEAMR